MSYSSIIDKLLTSSEPSIRWKVYVNVLGEDSDSKKVKALQVTIRKSPRVQRLLSDVDQDGKVSGTRSIYAKWQGTHWLMNTLADIGCPKDKILFAMRDRVLETWLDNFFYQEFVALKKSDAYEKEGVPLLQGRYRRCASQQGNALYFVLKLGVADERVHDLAERLLHWQWPDGGWNCDKEPSAKTSTFIHTLWSLRGLSLYSKQFNSEAVKQSVARSAELLLQRHLFKRKTNGKVIRPEFTLLHYPLYWHYDILGALKVMAEAGFIHDPRCGDALDLLESKCLPGKGWPSEKKYYKTSNQISLGNDFVDWGPTGKTKANEWVTADALYVLKAAGRLS